MTAVTVDLDPESTAHVRQDWERWGLDVPLVVLESPYRSTVGPLLAFVEELDAREPERGLAVVVLPEFVPAKRWQYLLHNQSALLLKAALLHGRTKTGGDRVIIDVPFHLHH